MATPKHILVIRFSALGDVAMTVPVLRNLLAQHPGLNITMVSDPFVAPMFNGIERLEFVGADTKKHYKGLPGLRRLANELNSRFAFDAVADLHNVLRSKIIRLFLRSVPKAAIEKGRAEKKELTRPNDKRLRQLKTGFQRYADVFEQLNVTVDLDREQGLCPKREPVDSAIQMKTGRKAIGIAPFARHLPKMYPLEKMKQVVDLVAAIPGYEVILFGSRAEASAFNQWETTNVRSLAGKMGFSEELAIIGNLHAMISMDSANMHLASMFGVRVVSVWGGTHPYLGFYGWGQSAQDAVQLELPCRPSSVFGNKPCPVHGEQGCMSGIEPEMIVEQLMLAQGEAGSR